MNICVRRWALLVSLSFAAGAVHADGSPQSLPYAQAWTDIGQITANDNWSSVPGVEGFLGQDLTTSTGTDPQTLLGTSAVANDLDVIANQTNTAITNGGVAEFHITDPVIALQGSGTADAPYVLINLNTIGQTGINVAYNVRDLDGSADNSVQPVALQYRVGNSGNFTNVPAGFIVDATTGPSLATLVTPISAALPASVDNQALVQVRILTTNAVGNDEWVGIDDISIIAGGGGGSPVLSVTDTSAAEGNSGNTPFLFTFNLSQPAGVGGVSIDYTTSAGTASDGSDFIGESGVANIDEGATSVTIDIAVVGDTTTEANETFFVDIIGATGATVGDAQGVGTINNDDVTLVPIHDIQGPGASSPLLGQSLSTVGIVTGVKTNGYFLQASDADADANPATSEGVFVFTSSAPPAAAAVGNRVQVTATVAEFVPSADPLQPPLTELVTPTVVVLTIGNALPTPVTLTTTFPDPTGPVDQLERLEGMRVTVPSLTVMAPTGGTTNEPNATGASNGVLHGVVTGIARPFREPGIQAPDPAPAGSTIPPLPRWDFNPELLSVDSDALGAATLNLSVGAVLTGLTGPLDYGFRRYTVMPEATPTVAAGVLPTAARAPTADEFTVAAYNMERFFDTTNDPGIGEPVLTAQAFGNRLNKASLAIRNFLNTPDILGVVEVENLSTLQAVATKINADAIAATQPDPQYVPYLQEGNDIGGIDVGFLVKSAEVAAGIDRIEVVAVTQHGKTTTWVEPDTSVSLLNDRPPLALDAIVHYADGRSFPITAIIVHQRSLNGADEDNASGVRVRAKRQTQAEFLANLIDDMQAADADRKITVLGDFNAFEFNDGYVDAMNVVTGTPTPDNQTAVAGDGVDLVATDLLNLASEEPVDQRYSFVFGGNAQSLDHVLINQALGAAVSDYSLDHARINADFPEINRNDANSPSRLADHDPALTYFTVTSELADLAVGPINPGSTEVEPGNLLTFFVPLRNLGPNDAEFPALGYAFDAELQLTLVPPVGWTCGTPIIGAGTTTGSCLANSFANGAMTGFEFISVSPASEVGQSINLAVAATSQTEDPVTANNFASGSTDIVFGADLSTQITGPDYMYRTTTSETYQIQISNVSSRIAGSTSVLIRVNVPTANVSLSGCTVAATPTFEAFCGYWTILPGGQREINLTLNGVGMLRKPSIVIEATSSLLHSVDPEVENDLATRKIRVIGVTGF